MKIIILEASKCIYKSDFFQNSGGFFEEKPPAAPDYMLVHLWNFRQTDYMLVRLYAGSMGRNGVLGQIHISKTPQKFLASGGGLRRFYPNQNHLPSKKASTNELSNTSQLQLKFETITNCERFHNKLNNTI